MVTAPPASAEASLVDQLYRYDGKAEIVGGRLVLLPLFGRMPAYAKGEVGFSLHLHVRSAELPGIAVCANTAFLVNLPNRRSFSPDAAYYTGPNSRMKFFEGAPRFAVEVRSENDYGFVAEEEIAAKRRDYFAAGTAAVWDVDLQSEEIVRKYTITGGADIPVALFRRGEAADAEPAVPGWSMSVDDLFEA